MDTTWEPLKQGCDGKQRFLTHTEAIRTLRMSVRRQQRAVPGEHLEVYHCSHCGGFHFGHSNKKERPHNKKKRSKTA